MEFKDTNERKVKTIETWYMVLRRIAFVCLFFAIIISSLLVLNYLRLKSIDPLQVKTRSHLIKQLGETPQDTQLKQQIRELDLISRKAFFVNRWQIRTGSYLLVGLVIIFLIILKNLYSIKRKFPDLTASIDEKRNWKDKLMARRIHLLVGGISLGIVLILGILSENHLDKITAPGKEPSVQLRDGEFLQKLRENWPNFRGMDGMGYSYNQKPPLEWNGTTGKNIKWKLTIPLPGFNSPIIWEEKLFLSGADKKQQVVYCIDRDQGKLVWQVPVTEVPGSPQKAPRTSSDTGYAAATMATDGTRVFVLFASGDIAALDLTGQVIWKKNLGVPNNHYGHSSSLLTYKDNLLIQYDQNSGGRLIALGTADGEVVYDVKRNVQISWASPIIANTGDRDELMLTSNPLVVAYDPLTGKELWQVNCMMGEVAPSLTYSDGMVFAVNENARLVGITLDTPPRILWEYDDELSEVSSPLAKDGLLIVATSYGPVSCFDTKSGTQLWMYEYDQGFYSSPILVGDNVYLTDMKGITFILKFKKVFEEIARNTLGEDVVATPAFVDNKIYIRGYQYLYCIAEQEK